MPDGSTRIDGALTSPTNISTTNALNNLYRHHNSLQSQPSLSQSLPQPHSSEPKESLSQSQLTLSATPRSTHPVTVVPDEAPRRRRRKGSDELFDDADTPAEAALAARQVVSRDSYLFLKQQFLDERTIYLRETMALRQQVQQLEQLHSQTVLHHQALVQAMMKQLSTAVSTGRLVLGSDNATEGHPADHGIMMFEPSLNMSQTNANNTCRSCSALGATMAPHSDASPFSASEENCFVSLSDAQPMTSLSCHHFELNDPSSSQRRRRFSSAASPVMRSTASHTMNTSHSPVPDRLRPTNTPATSSLIVPGNPFQSASMNAANSLQAALNALIGTPRDTTITSAAAMVESMLVTSQNAAGRLAPLPAPHLPLSLQIVPLEKLTSVMNTLSTLEDYKEACRRAMTRRDDEHRAAVASLEARIATLTSDAALAEERAVLERQQLRDANEIALSKFRVDAYREVEQTLDAAQKEAMALSRRNDQLQREVQALEKRIRELTAAVSTAEGANAHLQQQASTMAQERAELRHALLLMQKQVQQLQAAAAARASMDRHLSIAPQPPQLSHSGFDASISARRASLRSRRSSVMPGRSRQRTDSISLSELPRTTVPLSPSSPSSVIDYPPALTAPSSSRVSLNCPPVPSQCPSASTSPKTVPLPQPLPAVAAIDLSKASRGGDSVDDSSACGLQTPLGTTGSSRTKTSVRFFSKVTVNESQGNSASNPSLDDSAPPHRMK